jgi:serine/threonine protein kinase
MDLFIRHLSGPRSGRTDVCRIEPGQRIWIGRGVKNEIQVPDPLVSGSHASIVNEGGWLVISDNSSTNGLFWRGKKVDRATIRSGDHVILGWEGPEVELVYREGADAPAGPAPVRPFPPPGAPPAMLPPSAPAAPHFAPPPPLPPPPPAPLPPAYASAHVGYAGMAPAAPRMCPSCGRPLYDAAYCEVCASPRGATARRYPPPPSTGGAAAPPAAAPHGRVPPPLPSDDPFASLVSASGPRAPAHASAAPQRPPSPAPAPPAARAPAPRAPLSPSERARRALEEQGFQIREKRPAPFGVFIYRCERVTVGQEVLVKVLLRSPDEESADEKRFYREARLSARLHHPNVIAVYDVRAGLEYMLIVFESLRGRTLGEVLRQDGPLPARRALSVAAGVARALVYLHGLGMVHRNICPDNVMLTDAEEVKVADLGLMKSTTSGSASTDATLAGETLGSLGHIAPEQLVQAAFVDARADIYALGATLFHAIAGRAPHEPSERLESAAGGAPAPRLESAPAVVADLVARAMQRDPDDRFADASEMLAAIGAAERAISSGAGAPERGAALPSLESAIPEGSIGSASDGFAGRFKETQLVELLQMVEIHRKSGKLEISSDAGSGVLQFSDGRVVGADCGAATGDEGAYALLGMRSGFFRLRFCAVPSRRDAPTISAILFECMRRADESGGTVPAAAPLPEYVKTDTVDEVSPETPRAPAPAPAPAGERTIVDADLGDRTFIDAPRPAAPDGDRTFIDAAPPAAADGDCMLIDLRRPATRDGDRTFIDAAPPATRDGDRTPPP